MYWLKINIYLKISTFFRDFLLYNFFSSRKFLSLVFVKRKFLLAILQLKLGYNIRRFNNIVCCYKNLNGSQSRNWSSYSGFANDADHNSIIFSFRHPSRWKMLKPKEVFDFFSPFRTALITAAKRFSLFCNRVATTNIASGRCSRENL